MKKLALLVAVVGIVGLSSCSKDATKECKKTTGGVESVVTISKDKVKTCTGSSSCVEVPNSVSIEDAAKGFEAIGYTCK